MNVTKEITFDAAHRLMNYKGPCNNLHGHTYRLQATWHKDFLEDDMAIDFHELNFRLKEFIQLWDHRVLLHREDPLADLLTKAGQKVYTLPCNPTAERMVQIAKLELDCAEVKLWETPTSCAIG